MSRRFIYIFAILVTAICAVLGLQLDLVTWKSMKRGPSAGMEIQLLAVERPDQELLDPHLPRLLFFLQPYLG